MRRSTRSSSVTFQVETVEEQPVDKLLPEQTLHRSSLYLKNEYGEEERLYLPESGSCQYDEYLRSIPRVASRAQELKHYDEDTYYTGQRCLNVLQGEVAHAAASQVDCLVSAEATTCHVVALRSTHSASQPMVSLAHVDHVQESCLDAMVQEHLQHHDLERSFNQTQENDVGNGVANDDDFGFYLDEDFEEQKVQDELGNAGFLPNPVEPPISLSPPPSSEPIEMELHMVGGFLDKDGTSQELSNSLVDGFNCLAEKYKERVKISLSTAAISSLNGEHAPRSRGLGIDTVSGRVFGVPSSLPKHLEGPAVEVRSARRTFGDESESSTYRPLTVISKDGRDVRVEPFTYEKTTGGLAAALLACPDEVLLNMTSTSPEHESDQFCANFRRTLSFVNLNPPETVFSDQQPLVYTRSSTNLNEWIPTASI